MDLIVFFLCIRIKLIKQVKLRGAGAGAGAGARVKEGFI